MSHFIFLTAPFGDSLTCAYRVRADHIDWMSDRRSGSAMPHTVVSVNGTELKVEEPAHVILTYIKDPEAPLVGLDEIDYKPCPFEYKEKYGDEEGLKRYFEVMHIPTAKK